MFSWRNWDFSSVSTFVAFRNYGVGLRRAEMEFCTFSSECQRKNCSQLGRQWKFGGTYGNRTVFNLMAKVIRDCFNLTAWRSLTGLEKFVPPSRSIRYENQTNRGLVTSVFSRFRFGPMCMNFEFLLAPVIFSSVLTGRCDYSRAFFWL